MNRLKRIAHIGFFIALVVVIISIIFISIYNGEQNPDIAMPDLSKFSLEELSNEQIIHISIHYNSLKSHVSRSGNRSGVVGTYKDFDSDICDYSSKKITGIMTLSVTLAKDCTLKLDINSKVESGNLRFVLICDNEIIETIEATSDISFTYNVVGEHTYYVKALCENASVEITVKRLTI